MPTWGWSMTLLFIFGIVVAAAGLLATGFGIPIKDTTFGNSVVLGGVTGICSGLIMIGMAFVVRELKGIARLLSQGAVQVNARAGSGPAKQPAAGAAPPSLFPPMSATPDQAAAAGSAEPAPVRPPPANLDPPPWANEAASRARPAPAPEPQPKTEAVPGEPAPTPPPPIIVPERPKRNLLFATKKRDQPAAVAISPNGTGAANPEGGTPPVAPPPPIQAEPRISFDTAWPARADASPRPDQAVATGASDVNTAKPTERPVPPPSNAAASPPVTVIKSGVVDGMAYSLYSDGSIEAQMPEGMIRFGSLDELRSYLEQRS